MPHPDPDQPPRDTPDQLRAQDDLVEQALYNLTPFFMEGAAGDPARARRAAVEMLKVYPINSMLDLQLVTEFIAFSQSAVDTLRTAKADLEMSESQRQTLRVRAVSLNGAAHRTMRFLNKMYKARMCDAEARMEPTPTRGLDSEQAAMLQAMRDRVERHREQMAARQFESAAAPAASPAFRNREQRRAVELAARREARQATG
jgi:hypothetical protein